MAITTDDFSKIWASTSPLTPYEFSESNYKDGWNFIGGTPPSRQMWDFLQKQNDEKSQYLLNNFDNYLPLSGGTLTGDLSVNGTITGNLDGNVTGNLTGDVTGDLTGTASGNLALSGGTITGNLEVNGNLTQNGKTVERVNASGTDYIRYESGLQICWSAITVNKSYAPNEYDTRTWTYPVAFNTEPIILCNPRHDRFNVGTKDVPIGNSSCTIYSTNTGAGNYTLPYIDCFAIGKWK